MPAPLEVFCCYAREDQKMLKQLKKHLTPLERQGQIVIRSDMDLNAGVEWEKELHQYLESADVILLLISPDFIASDYCYSIEMEQALTRHNEGSARVIAILLRAIFLQDVPFAKLQIIPTNAKPVTNWSDRDDAFEHITSKVYEVVSELRDKQAQIKVEGDRREQQRPELVAQLQTIPKSAKPVTNRSDRDEASHDTTPQVTPIVSELRTRQAQMKVEGDGREQRRGVIAQPMPAQGVFFVPTFNPAKLILLRTLEGHADIVRDVTISPDGFVLASASKDKTIRLWKFPFNQEPRILRGHTESVGSVAFSPDGTLLASGGQDYTIKLWDISSGRELRTLTGHTNIVRGVAFSPDGALLASGGNDRTVRLWEVSSGRELRPPLGRNGAVVRVVISPNGKILAGGGSTDHTIRLWELPSRRELHTLTDHAGNLEDMAMSPDGTILASGNNDRTITLWEVSTGQGLRTLSGHTGEVWGIAFNPDGTLLASASKDKTIKLWEVSTGQELCTLTDHTRDVGSVVFSPDGTLLASGSDDKTIKLWGMKP